MNQRDIRQAWLNYYSEKGYSVIPSAPLVHPAFPLSFNMSAGMVQLDPILRSNTEEPSKKECLVQKCVRHFDVQKVGNETHLSFFEMLGAFEVKNFDEIQTVKTLYDFLISIVKISSEKIWITCFDEDLVHNQKIEQDSELISFLKNLAKDHLILAKKETNLWQQGGVLNLKTTKD